MEVIDFLVKTDFFIYMLLMPFALYFALFMHELSHYIVVKAAGWKVVAFKPYPCEAYGKRYRGVVLYEPEEHNKHLFPYVCSAPLWMSFILVQIFVVLSFKFYLPLITFVVAEIIDYFTWWWHYLCNTEGSDGSMLRHFSKYGSQTIITTKK